MCVFRVGLSLNRSLFIHRVRTAEVSGEWELRIARHPLLKRTKTGAEEKKGSAEGARSLIRRRSAATAFLNHRITSRKMQRTRRTTGEEINLLYLSIARTILPSSPVPGPVYQAFRRWLRCGRLDFPSDKTPSLFAGDADRIPHRANQSNRAQCL